MKYGILIGRFQPLHTGHQQIIESIVLDGLCPVIFIGSATERRTARNPFSYQERRNHFLEDTLVDADLIFPIADNPSDAEWTKRIIDTLMCHDISTSECVLYFYHKEGDRDIGDILKYYFRIHYPNIELIDICATDIRNNPEAHKDSIGQYIFDDIMRVKKEIGMTINLDKYDARINTMVANLPNNAAHSRELIVQLMKDAMRDGIEYKYAITEKKVVD